MAVTPELVQGIKNGFALYPAIIMAIGLLLMLKLYSLTPAKMEEIKNDMETRKEA
jgi:Na+/melibiose symporter-like transporter